MTIIGRTKEQRTHRTVIVNINIIAVAVVLIVIDDDRTVFGAQQTLFQFHINSIHLHNGRRSALKRLLYYILRAPFVCMYYGDVYQYLHIRAVLFNLKHDIK